MLQKNRKAKFGGMWLILRRKKFLLIFVPFYCFEQKGLFTTNPNLPQDFPIFKLVKKIISEYFNASFCDNHFLTKKRSFH